MGLIAGVRRYVYEAFVIPVNSMSPTILAGDRILARKLLPRDFFPERGDMIVYRNPTSKGGTRFMGRVVARNFDSIQIRNETIVDVKLQSQPIEFGQVDSIEFNSSVNRGILSKHLLGDIGGKIIDDSRTEADRSGDFRPARIIKTGGAQALYQCP